MSSGNYVKYNFSLLEVMGRESSSLLAGNLLIHSPEKIPLVDSPPNFYLPHQRFIPPTRN